MPITGGQINTPELKTIKDHVAHLERAVNETERLVGILSDELLGKVVGIDASQITSAKISGLSTAPGIKQRTSNAVEMLDKLNKTLDNLRRELTQSNDIVVAPGFDMDNQGNVEFRGEMV